MAEEEAESSDKLPEKDNEFGANPDSGKEKETDSTEVVSAQETKPRNEIRDYMVTTAIHFLQNPKVKTSPLYQKKAFLLKKGLTAEEVEVAIAKAGIETSVALQQAPSSVVAPINQLPIQPPPSSSLWTWWKDVTYTIIVLGSSLYGVYCFYKDYLEPRWFGKTSTSLQHKIPVFEEQLQDVNLSLSTMRESLACVESSLLQQDKKIQKLVKGVSKQEQTTYRDSATLAELKSEVTSIKALLLGRKQFPSNPVVGIPSWQLNGDTKPEDALAKEQIAVSEKKHEDGDKTLAQDIEATLISATEVSNIETKLTTNGEVSAHDGTESCTS